MKVVYIIPGSGDKFYCENCMRDLPLVREMEKQGVETSIIPLYLPLFIDEDPISDGVFYGAVNIYLKEKFRLFRKQPEFLRRFFDSRFLLKLAAGMSGATSAEGLEDMTISILKGDDDRQISELERLIAHLESDIKPDLIHISNALLIGLGVKLKEVLGVPLVCSLQDEDTWLDSMGGEARERAWSFLRENGKKTDIFLPVSENYKKIMERRIQLYPEQLNVVPIGIDLEKYKTGDEPPRYPAIGYLSRLTAKFGLDILARAYIIVKKEIPNLKLYITGGYTSEDRKFVKKVRSILLNHIRKGDVVFINDFDIQNRNYFFNSISLLSVPLIDGEAFGTYQIEAMACGVPVLQPHIGAFPEIISNTGGGTTYFPNTPEQLAIELISMLSDREKLTSLGLAGRDRVRDLYSIEKMATSVRGVYNNLLGNEMRKGKQNDSFVK